jgi:hypothetical protein
VTTYPRIFYNGDVVVKYDKDFDCYLITNAFGSGSVRIAAAALDGWQVAIQAAMMHRDHGVVPDVGPGGIQRGEN